MYWVFFLGKIIIGKLILTTISMKIFWSVKIEEKFVNMDTGIIRVWVMFLALIKEIIVAQNKN